MGEYSASYNVYIIIIKEEKCSTMWKQQVLSRAGVGVGLVGCTPLVVGLHPFSLCGVLSRCAKPPGHTSGGSGGGSLQPQPSPNQCYESLYSYFLEHSHSKDRFQ